MKKLWLLCALACGLCGGYDNFNAAYRDGLKAMSKRDYQKVIDIQSQAAKLGKNDEQIFSAKISASLAALRLKNYAVAEQMTDDIFKLKKLSPNSRSLACMRRGEIAFEQKKIAEAQKYFEQCVAIKANHWSHFSALLCLCNIYQKNKQYDLVDKYAFMLINHPKVSESNKYFAYRRLYWCAISQKDNAKAEKYLQSCEAIAQSGKIFKQAVSQTLSMRGLIYRNQKKFAQAIACYEKICADKNVSKGNINDAMNLQAWSYWQLKDYKKAKEIIDKTPRPYKWVKGPVDKSFAQLSK